MYLWCRIEVICFNLSIVPESEPSNDEKVPLLSSSTSTSAFTSLFISTVIYRYKYIRHVYSDKMHLIVYCNAAIILQVMLMITLCNADSLLFSSFKRRSFCCSYTLVASLSWYMVASDDGLVSGLFDPNKDALSSAKDSGFFAIDLVAFEWTKVEWV